MLAQNFKTPTDLGLSDVEFESLVKVLGMLERGEIAASHFDMSNFRCGTSGCICGWANYVSCGLAFPEVGLNPFDRVNPLQKRLPTALQVLFDIQHDKTFGVFENCSPDQAATALRSYLRTGNANWREALALSKA